MAIILHIETSSDKASICVSNDLEIITCEENIHMLEHGAWLHTAIQKVLPDRELQYIDAISISMGPGSYTGLRIGMAAAKGLCYVLNKPLIAINTLNLIALSVPHNNCDLICPMIDARRNEVFCAVTDLQGNWIQAPHSLVLDENSFSSLLSEHRILFIGNGAEKWQQLCSSANALFSFFMPSAKNMVPIALQMFQLQNFANLAYCEPLYIKEVYIQKKIS